ncbi:MAG: DUF3465 domain-containing protein [Pseudomonadales bacterium]|nr:DUF3465 domain-containing protein [Pseudomonadales bacterium]
MLSRQGKYGKGLGALGAIILVALALTRVDPDQSLEPESRAANDEIRTAFLAERSGVQVLGTGSVKAVLPDDTKGSRHQRFILELSQKLTILVAHNIDLAPRIGRLEIGDQVSFYGVYEFNNQGGVVHWTHRDPGGRHVAGWLEHQGKRYD